MTDYKILLKQIMDYQMEESKNTFSSKTEGNDYREIYSKNENILSNSDFLFSGLKLIQSEPTEAKYNFLTALGNLLYYGAKFKKGPNSSTPYTSIEEIINKLTSFDEIFGRSLSLPNATKLATRMIFSPDQVTTEKHMIQGFEIAPLINGWVDMLVSIKEDWKDSTDQKLLEGCFKNHEGYTKYINLRENLLDEMIAKGRLESRVSLSRSY